MPQHDIENGSTIQQTLRLFGGGSHDPKKARIIDPTMEEYFDRTRLELAATLNAQTKNTQDTIEADTDTIIHDLHGRGKRQAKRLEQPEQAKRTTPNDPEEDTERSTRAIASGFPPVSTAIIEKSLQDVLQRESLTAQVTQIRCTADPETHAFLTFNTKSEKKRFVNKLRRSQHVGGDCTSHTLP